MSINWWAKCHGRKKKRQTQINVPKQEHQNTCWEHSTRRHDFWCSIVLLHHIISQCGSNQACRNVTKRKRMTKSISKKKVFCTFLGTNNLDLHCFGKKLIKWSIIKLVYSLERFIFTLLLVVWIAGACPKGWWRW